MLLTKVQSFIYNLDEKMQNCENMMGLNKCMMDFGLIKYLQSFR